MNWRSPHAMLRAVPQGAVRWTSGFWADRFDLCRRVILPQMHQALLNPSNGAVLQNFHVAAGLQPGQFCGRDWSDGDCYKWLEAVARVYGVTGESQLDRLMDDIIAVIAKAQAPDGYICTQIQLTGRKRWEKKRRHELYNMGHLLTAASVHHRVTGKQNFLDVARKVGDYLYSVFQPRPRELAHFGWNPSNIMGLVDLYRTTSDRRYLELAGIFVDMRGSAPQDWTQDPDRIFRDGGDQNQDRVPLRKETEAVGHAVTAMYLYAGAADVCAETGEPALREALHRIWCNVVERKMYVTGGVGAYHHGVSPRGDLVHEAFGRDYELPARTAYNETCANIAHAMWCLRMLHLTSEAKYADVMEQVLYNSALSAVSLDGTRFFYTNPLARAGPEMPLFSNDTAQRWTTFRCYCCPPQVARTLAGLHEWAYCLSDDSLWVNLYGGSVLTVKMPGRGTLRILQETNYPWDGQVTFHIQEAPRSQFTLNLRIPGWADGATVQVKGQPASAPVVPGAYFAVVRKWEPGDEVLLNLSMPVRLIESHPEVEQTRNQVAVMRGPIVYCLESPDLPQGVQVEEVFVPYGTEWEARFERDLLGGVSVIEAQLRRWPRGDWTGRLYRPLQRGPMERLAVRLIPYYAWANRGVSEMRVWLPLC